ncbi:Cyclin-dependent kinase [Bertholletia excelsa]
MKREKAETVFSNPAMASIPKAIEGEQVAAGWPSCLASVAGEAIEGWVPRRADTFEKLDKIGQGTYSSVYKARDLTHNKVVALKRVRFDNMDPESVKFMAREILILRRLDHPNIIKLEGLVVSRNSCSLYLVFEYMEHDLLGLASLPGVKFSEPQVKCYMQQLLSGLDHCHSRGVLHRDIKGSNLLIDNHGILKIADFGLASFYDSHHSVPLTSRVVTLWYRPPELLLGATFYGVSVDLWSTGCVIGELYASKPIMPGRTEVEQLHKIVKLCGSPSEEYWRKLKLTRSTVFRPVQTYKRCLAETFKDFPPTVVQLMETLLSIDPASRGTAASALKSEYFTTKPLACDPSCLPKYPPSKEIDAKLREEEARRKGGPRFDQRAGGPKLPHAVSVSNANPELVTLMQSKQVNSNPKCHSEVFNPYKVEAATGFPIDPPRKTKAIEEVGQDLMDHNPRKDCLSGPLVGELECKRNGKKYGSMEPHLVASRTSSSKEYGTSPSQSAVTDQVTRSMESYDASQPKRKSEKKFGKRSIIGSHQPSKGGAFAKDFILQGFKGNKIQFSGPLFPSNVDQILKDHDRQIREAARRARLEKGRLGKA